MKRITGTFVLLAGLSGCMAINGPPDPTDKRVSQGKALPTPPPTRLASNLPMPAAPMWEPDPGHIQNGSYESGTDALPAPRPVVGAPMAAPSPPGYADGRRAVQPPTSAPAVVQSPPAPLPPSLTPMVTTPRPQPGPAGAVANAPMPVVITPNSDQKVERAVCFTRQDATEPNVVQAKSEAPAPATPKGPITMPPMPSVKSPPTGEPHVARGGMPLMRLVNTKRITLNFEVKDVGPSGLSGVELWYTQDCREWKKYDAPTQAKAYVVEVDEEGMYGFTLLAKSGIGLGKQPPAPGDQPQVWVIVDLTPPAVELLEVTPSISYKVQQVAFRWRASDKNLSRKPISLFYAEKKNGPWKVIATNLENNGKYVWKVPSEAPAQFLVRAEAIDLAGNVGRAQSPHPILLDSRVPSVSIVNVEANAGH
jgi:hypothetical protein